MRATWGVVIISGCLLLFLINHLEKTTCQGLVASVAPNIVLRRQTAAAAEVVLFPLIDSDLLNIALVLLTGIKQPGNIVAHATESDNLDFQTASC